MIEEFKNNSEAEGSNEWVLAMLAERLQDIQIKLGKSKKVEDFGVADEEDQAEAGEEIEARQAMAQVLSNEEQEILGAKGWIEKHGDACAFTGCSHQVEIERRKADPASITCKEHREEEDRILRDIMMGL